MDPGHDRSAALSAEPSAGPSALLDLTVRWDCQVGLLGGTVRWDCQVGLSGGTVRWDCQVGLSAWNARLDCQGIVRWNARSVCQGTAESSRRFGEGNFAKGPRLGYSEN